MGRFIHKHKGSGIIVDDIFKPMKSVLSSLTETVVNPFAQKALQSGILPAGNKLGKKPAEKSGDSIMKQLASRFNKSKTTMTKPNIPVKEESTDMILNRFISGSGIKKDEIKIMQANNIHGL